MNANLNIINVSPDNVEQYGLFCIKNKRNPGYKQKLKWFLKEYEHGLRIKILENQDGEQLGFIEYTDAEYAWRPVYAPGYLFMHCMYIYKKDNKGKGYGSILLEDVLKDARERGKYGIVCMTSKGPWIADDRLMIKQGFHKVDEYGRYELMVYSLKNGVGPKLKRWTEQLEAYEGWHLLYANQCPWHQKCATELRKEALLHDIDLQVSEISSHEAAQSAPSGFGVFALIKDNELLVDHYISKTRFKNILNKVVGVK